MLNQRSLCGGATKAPLHNHQRHLVPTGRVGVQQRSQVTASARYKVVEDAPLSLAPAATEAPAAAPVAPAPVAEVTTAAAPAPVVTPDVPAAAPSSLSVPELPSLSVPDLPKVSVPDLPKVSVPDVTAATDQLNASVSQAAAGVTDKAAELAGAASKATSTVTESAGKAAEQLTSVVSGATSSVTNTLSGLGSGVTSNVSNLTSSLGQGVSSVTSQIGSVTGQVGDTVGGTLSGLKSSLNQATAGVSGVVGSTLDQVTTSTKAATDAVSSVVSSSTAAVQQTFEGVSSQVTAVSSSVASSVDATTQQVLGALPPPVKDALVAAGGAAAAVGGAAAAHPKEAAVVALAVGVPTAYRYYKGRFGGYAGEASPEKVFELLSDDDNIFLVDIRPEEQREREGLPQLKLGARYKVAAFPIQVTIPSRIAREAENAEQLRLQVNAAFIAGLPQCQGALTKMIIMDSSGSDKARDLARALTSLGQPLSYVMTGGFKAWAAAELPVLEGESEYDASTSAVLSDNVEVLAEKANEAVKTVAQPNVALPLAGGSALAAYAAFNIHTTLEFIGVLGVLLTVVNKALSYDSPAAALEDAKGAASGVQKALSKLGSVKPPALPNLPKLPQTGGKQPMRVAAMGGGSGSNSRSAAGAASLSAAAVGGGSSSSSSGDAVDVGAETEQELVD